MGQKKMYFIKSGYDLSVSTPRVKLLFADDYLTVHPGDFWSDIKTTGLDNEGYVEFLNGKKPLKLIRRYVNASTSNNDIVLDFFGGSGTTAQAVIQNNLENKLRNMYIICEMGDYFDLKTKVRVIKTYCVEKVSGFFKYLRLESYEDTLNNLVLTERKSVPTAMQKDYLLNYFLSLETQDSPSLLNIPVFTDPTAYQLKVKKTGSESSTLKIIDLIETFNYLIGLSVQHIANPMIFSADFTRETDPDLPTDTNTRLIAKIKANDTGEYWFRLIEGYTIPNPAQPDHKEAVLIVWRKLTDDAEKDNAVLQTYLMDKLKISPREKTYAIIYVNGSHTLPNPVVDGEQTKVRLIEETFHRAMWSGEDA
jgi:adenine-specific DNA-methyltransferase